MKSTRRDLLRNILAASLVLLGWKPAKAEMDYEARKAELYRHAVLGAQQLPNEDWNVVLKW